MSRYEAPVREYDEEKDLAVYDAGDIEYVVDTGIYIDCPECGDSVVLSKAVDDGCWDHGCGRGPWSVEVRQ